MGSGPGQVQEFPCRRCLLTALFQKVAFLRGKKAPAGTYNISTILVFQKIIFWEEKTVGTYNISTMLVKNILPHMAQQNKVLFPKHSPWSKNSDFGVAVAWGLF